jgi:cysteine-rich repeat protein
MAKNIWKIGSGALLFAAVLACSDPPPQPSCGDGEVNESEDCDDGNTNNFDSCLDTCVAAFCGDGFVYEGTEACDDGNTDSNDGCNSSCEFEFCGDGVVQTDPNRVEKCDDGNSESGDGCDANCQEENCGDGIVNNASGGLATEECDLGGSNSNTGVCTLVCRDAVCGDGFEQAGEECDNGAQNSDTTPNACRVNCSLAGCGDGVLDSGEDCDDGQDNSNTGANACRENCERATCGDNVVDSGEQCDGGAGCAANCTLPGCGNGVIDGGELCDDNNEINGDGCDINCIPTGCGNLIITSNEECDDGNTVQGTSNDFCENDCSFPVCGNGIRDVAIGEACDDGNGDLGDGCRPDCTQEPPPIPNTPSQILTPSGIAGATLRDVVVGSFNSAQDSFLDVLLLVELPVAQQEQASILVFLGTGNGNFSSPISIPIPTKKPRAIALSLVNGDNFLDIVTSHRDDANNRGVLQVLHGNGLGNVVGLANLSASKNFGDFKDIVPGNINPAEDNNIDLSTIDTGNNKFLIFKQNTAEVFSELSFGGNINNSLSNPAALLSADIDADGDQDFFVVNQGTQNVLLFRMENNTIEQVLTYAAPVFFAGEAPGAAAALDCNEDNVPDLAVLTRNDSKVHILFGNNNGSVSNHLAFSTGPQPVSITSTDLDLDGNPDLVTANESNGTITVLRGIGGCSFVEAATRQVTTNGVPNFGTKVIVKDVDSDGVSNIIVLNNVDKSIEIF